MSTRSRIAIERADGTISSIYCHFDGYPDGVGKCLAKHYTAWNKVQRLLDLGDISYIAERVEPTPGGTHSFDNPERDVVVAYGRDRGEGNVEANEHPSLSAFVSDMSQDIFIEYFYVFNRKRGWTFYDGAGTAFPTWQDCESGDVLAPAEIDVLVCPHCGAIDSIVVHQREHHYYTLEMVDGGAEIAQDLADLWWAENDVDYACNACDEAFLVVSEFLGAS